MKVNNLRTGALTPTRPSSIVVDTKNRLRALSYIAIVSALSVVFAFPERAHAGILSDFTTKVKAVFLGAPESVTGDTSSSQTMPVFKPIVVDDASDTPDAGDASSSDDALSATTGALRVSTEDIDYPLDDTISVYEVKKGDTIATVAKLFGVSKNTITWANDLKSDKLTPGQTIVILPITGVRVTAKNGDTIAGIAKKYKGDADDIAKYNGIATDAKLASGDVIIVPEGEISAPTIATVKKTISKVTYGLGTGSVSTYEKLLDTYTNSTPAGFLIRPIVGGRKSQGLHGHNGVDLAANIGTPVMASGSGTVIAAKSSGYNGGYGEMIIIAHANNVQTVYGHLSQVNVSVGQVVSQGEVIGAVGNTGKSTGPHLHFEVRGAKNPF
jgi:murein DD-endopeptidase MepM/ murein hydrolase activator NlpD